MLVICEVEYSVSQLKQDIRNAVIYIIFRKSRIPLNICGNRLFSSSSSLIYVYRIVTCLCALVILVFHRWRCSTSWRSDWNAWAVMFSIPSSHLDGARPLVLRLSTLPCTLSFSRLSSPLGVIFSKYCRLRLRQMVANGVHSWLTDSFFELSIGCTASSSSTSQMHLWIITQIRIGIWRMPEIEQKPFWSF